MTRRWFYVVALLAGWRGEVIAQQQFGDFTYGVNGDTVAILDYPEPAKGNIVILATIDGKLVTSIGNNAFAYCALLTGITIPDSVTKISDNAFNQCTGLTTFTVGEGNPNYSVVDGILFNKDQSKLLQYPAGKAGGYSIPSHVTGIGSNAFYFSAGLASVTFSNSVTSIGPRAFANCSGLTSVTIPNSVTNIGQSAFANCAGLTSVKIGNGVNSIGNWAFIECNKLTSVHFDGNAPKAGAGMFTGADIKELKLHIYEGSTGFELPPWDVHAKNSIKHPAK